MQSTYDTLFLPLSSGSVPMPEPDQAVLFLNATACSHLDMLQNNALDMVQYFKPYAAHLEVQQARVFQDIPDGAYDLALVLAPKNKQEAQYLLASAAARLREGGTLLCAAANDAGGKRLKDWMATLGFATIHEESKHKARAVWAQKTGPLNTAKWIESGEPQTILKGQYVSQPGIFGWNKIDQGSQILAQHLPSTLSGTGADFGCGYGYLSVELLQHNTDIKTLYAIDADARSIAAVKQNLEPFNPNKEFLWLDLAQPVPSLRNTLDWIVMNPPFHEGKGANIEIGSAFIKTAADSLKPSGLLYMVANAHLPYEDVLNQNCSSVEHRYEGSGFKVFAAQK